MEKRKEVWYVAHPVTADDKYTVRENVNNAIAWIKYLTHADPSRVYIAPWIAEVLAFIDAPVDPAFYDRVLADDCEVVRHCDGIIQVGGRQSRGMQLELDAARKAGKKVMHFSFLRSPEDMQWHFAAVSMGVLEHVSLGDEQPCPVCGGPNDLDILEKAVIDVG